MLTIKDHTDIHKLYEDFNKLHEEKMVLANSGYLNEEVREQIMSMQEEILDEIANIINKTN